MCGKSGGLGCAESNKDPPLSYAWGKALNNFVGFVAFVVRRAAILNLLLPIQKYLNFHFRRRFLR